MADIGAPPLRAPAEALGMRFEQEALAPATHAAGKGAAQVWGEAIALDLAAELYPDIKFALGYWLAKKGDRLAPASRDIDPMEIAPVLPRITLIDVLASRSPPAGPEFRYCLAGTGIAHAYGRALVNKSAHELEPAAFGELVCRHYAEALARHAPVAHRIRFDIGAFRGLYVRMTLPLSDDGQTIGRLMTVGCSPENPQELRNCFRALG
jgi:hypothetical protein